VRLLFADHTLDIDRRELRHGSEPVAVEPQVFDLLIYLVQNRDRVVSKDDLIASVWDGRIGFVKFTFSVPVRVVPQADIVRVSDGQSHVDFPLRLFKLTTPPRCRRCERIAEPKVRIHPPAASLQTIAPCPSLEPAAIATGQGVWLMRFA